MIRLSRSTYYYRSEQDEAKAKEDADIRDRMEDLALEFPRYGYRRMAKQLQRENWKVNHKRVLRLMRESDILVRPRRRFVKTTDSDHNLPIYPNLLKDFEPDGLDQAWVSDITYIRIRTGFAFLATVLDAHSRKVVGWALSRGITAELTCAALEAACAARHPVSGLIFHSDRGVQYCSSDFVALARDKYGMRLSMSRKANPYDNAIAESFFKTLKVEEIYLTEVPSYEELERRLPEYLETIYNGKRLHSALGYLPPVEYEAKVKGTESVGNVTTTEGSCPG